MSYSKQNFRSGDTLYASQLNAMDDEIAVLDAEVESTKNMVGSPLTASTAAGMSDQTKIYVYTGNETGYTAGHWYYYNGTAWTDGGVYNSVAVNTDTSLRVSGQAADSKAVGDAIDDLDSDLTDLKSDLSELESAVNTLPGIKNSNAESVDLDVSDPSGNVIARFANGHIQTKNFDSADIPDLISEVSDAQTAINNALKNSAYAKNSSAVGVDLDVSDNTGNVIMRLSDGHIMTKNFDSRKIGTLANLSTTEKSTLVGAVNEVNTLVNENKNAIENLKSSLCYFEKERSTFVQLNNLVSFQARKVDLTLPYKSDSYASVDVSISGKNLLDFENATVIRGNDSSEFTKNESSLSVTSGRAYIDILTVTPDVVNKHFILSATTTGDGAYRVCVHPKNSKTMTGSNNSFHVGANYIGHVLCVVFFSGTSETNYTNIQLEVGSTATTYEEYYGAKYTVNLPNGYYGGTADLVAGKGKNKYASDGTEISGTDVTFTPCNVTTLSGYNCIHADYIMELDYYVPVVQEVDSLKQSNPERILLFDRNKPVNGFAYAAFSGGCILGGKEVYVSRYGTQHTTPTNHSLYGRLGFIRRDYNGNINDVAFPDLGYGNLDCELRDPNICNINQNTAFLSGFATNNDESTPIYSNYLYVINSDLTVVDSNVFVTDKLFWGNTLITPEGYLLHCAYDTSSKLYLMRSTSPYSSTVNNIAFTASQTLDNAANESTVFYWDNKLVVIARTTDAVSDCVLFVYA